jgi:cytochrome P450
MTAAAQGGAASAVSPNLPRLDLADPSWAGDPYPMLDALRGASPLAESDRGLEVLDHATGLAVLRDRRYARDHMTIVDAVGITSGPAREYKQRMLLSQKGEQHLRLRLPLARYFAPARTESLRAQIRTIVDTLLDEVDPTQPANLFTALFNRVPAEVYCMLVAAPREDAPFVSRVSDQVLAIFERDPSMKDSIEAGYAELLPYVRERIAERRTALGDDILSSLIRLQRAGELTEDELVDEASTLVEASTDNTAHQMGLVVAALLERPDVWRRLVDDRSLVPRAVDEGVRFEARVRVVTRIATGTTELLGHPVPAGGAVNVVVPAGHRDPARAPDPHAFDLDRESPPQLLTFGGGAYACIGMHLAKIEAQEVLDALLTRFPKAELTAPVTRGNNAYVATTPEVPVVLSPR